MTSKVNPAAPATTKYYEASPDHQPTFDEKCFSISVRVFDKTSPPGEVFSRTLMLCKKITSNPEPAGAVIERALDAMAAWK